MRSGMKNALSRGAYRKLCNGVLLALAAISSSAYADIGDNVKGSNTPSHVVPFSVGFSPDGPIVFDQKGEKIQLIEVKFPIKAAEIQRVDTVSAIRVKGSCFYLLQFAGVTYQIPLPHASCQE